MLPRYVAFLFPSQLTQPYIEPVELTPELSPIQQGAYFLTLTPLFEKNKDPMYELYRGEGIESLQDFTLESTQKPKKTKKIQKQTGSRPRLYSNWLFIENDLENILEEDEKYQENSSESESSSEEDEIDNEDEEASDDLDEMDENSQKLNDEEEKYSTTNLKINKNQISSLQWEQQNPKSLIISELKSIINGDDLLEEEEKIQLLKQKIKYYLFQHQYYVFQHAFKELEGSLKFILNTLLRGVEETFKKTIGGLMFEKRRLKMLKYMEKKKGRVWRKKVNYNCRKQVADKRLRIKGKFVTQQQALEQLGLQSIEGYTPNELKQMLEKKIEQ